MIYFVQAGTTGHVKIGYAADCIHKRLGKLRTDCPYPVRLLGVMNGGKARETVLHERFSFAWFRGEWFLPAPELMAFIEENSHQPGPPRIDTITDS